MGKLSSLVLIFVGLFLSGCQSTKPPSAIAYMNQWQTGWSFYKCQELNMQVTTRDELTYRILGKWAILAWVEFSSATLTKDVFVREVIDHLAKDGFSEYTAYRDSSDFGFAFARPKAKRERIFLWVSAKTACLYRF